MRNTSYSNNLQNPHSKSPLIKAFGTFFFFLMLCEVLLTYIASSTYTGTVINGSKREQMQYNSKIIGNIAKQNSLKWHDSITIKQENSRIYISFLLQDQERQIIDCKHVEGKIMRPVTDKYDTTIQLSKLHGLYIGEVDLPLPGQWDIYITATCQNNIEFFSSKRIIANFTKNI